MSDWNDETAEWYAQKYGEYATNRLAIEALELAADCVVVDVGCGTGSALRHASEKVTDGRLIGIDPVPRMVEIARQQTADHPAHERIGFLPGAAENLPLEDHSADVVLAFDSFDHWQDKARGLGEIRRILRSNGCFAVVKDGGLPGVSKARRAFMGALADAGFVATSEQDITETDVSFTLWTCETEQEP